MKVFKGGDEKSNDIRFREALLAALDDPLVKKKLRKLMGGVEDINRLDVEDSQAEGKRLTAEAAQWELELQRLKEQLTASQRETGELRAEYDRRIVEDHQQIEKLRETISTLNGALSQKDATLQISQAKLEDVRRVFTQMHVKLEPFQELLTIYEKYCSLPEQFRQEARKALPDNDPVLFFTFGCQRDCLESFWDRASSRAEQMTEQELTVLREIITYFVARLNSLWEDAIYELIDDAPGTPFDDERHMRTARCSRYQGNIRCLLLPGIWNRGTGKALRQALVEY